MAGCTWVASYDTGTGEILENNIWQGQNDLHSANPFFIRPDGRIQVMFDNDDYSDKTITWKVSNEPYSIKGFGELQESVLEGDIVQGRQFYPMVHNASGEVYLVINALRDNLLRKTVSKIDTLWLYGRMEGWRDYATKIIVYSRE